MHPHQKQKRSDLKNNPDWVSRYSNTIRNLRKSKGLSQAQFAKEIGVDRGAIIDIEKGNTDPTLSTLEAMASFLNITIDELVGRNPQNQPETHQFSAKSLASMSQFQSENVTLRLINKTLYDGIKTLEEIASTLTKES